MAKHPGKLSATLGATALVALGSAFFAFDFYSRLGVPDFDQKWSSLPNGGSYYCLPTSYLDVMTYMHNHGVPEVPDLVSMPIDERIAILGDLFGTDPERGTSAGVANGHMQSWLSQSSNPIVLLYVYGAGWDWGMTQIRQAIESRSMVIIGYGRYHEVINNEYVRGGGHVVVASGFDLRTGIDELLVKDPAKDDGNNNQQGPWATYEAKMRGKSFKLYLSGGGSIRRAEYAYNASTQQVFRAVDSMYQFMPAVGGWSNALYIGGGRGRSRGGEEERIFVEVPFEFTPERGEEPQPKRYEVIPRRPVLDWVFDLGNLSVIYLTTSGEIYEHDLNDGTRHYLLAEIPGARQLMIGGISMDVFVLGDSVANSSESAEIYRIEREDNSVMGISIPYGVRSMEYDPVTGGPGLLLSATDRVFSYNEHLTNRKIVTLTNVPSGTGELFLRINPEDGGFIYGRIGSSRIRVEHRSGVGFHGFLDLPGVSDLRTLISVRENLMLVQDGDRMRTFTGFGQPSTSQFDGLRKITGTFKMNRSHYAAEKGFDSGPGWHNIEPEDLQ